MSREPVAWGVADAGWPSFHDNEQDATEAAAEAGGTAYVAPLYAEPPELGELARALVEKLDVVHEDPAYKGVWGLHYVHGGHYTGPTYTDELGALRSALAQYEDKGGTGC